MDVVEGRSEERVNMAHDSSSFAEMEQTASAHAVALLINGRMEDKVLAERSL